MIQRCRRPDPARKELAVALPEGIGQKPAESLGSDLDQGDQRQYHGQPEQGLEEEVDPPRIEGKEKEQKERRDKEHRVAGEPLQAEEGGERRKQGGQHPREEEQGGQRDQEPPAGNEAPEVPKPRHGKDGSREDDEEGYRHRCDVQDRQGQESDVAGQRQEQTDDVGPGRDVGLQCRSPSAAAGASASRRAFFHCTGWRPRI